MLNKKQLLAGMAAANDPDEFCASLTLAELELLIEAQDEESADDNRAALDQFRQSFKAISDDDHAITRVSFAPAVIREALAANDWSEHSSDCVCCGTLILEDNCDAMDSDDVFMVATVIQRVPEIDIYVEHEFRRNPVRLLKACDAFVCRTCAASEGVAEVAEAVLASAKYPALFDNEGSEK